MSSVADLVISAGLATVQGGSVFIQNFAPPTAKDGDLWVDSTKGQIWRQISGIWKAFPLSNFRGYYYGSVATGVLSPSASDNVTVTRMSAGVYNVSCPNMIASDILLVDVYAGFETEISAPSPNTRTINVYNTGFVDRKLTDPTSMTILIIGDN